MCGPKLAPVCGPSQPPSTDVFSADRDWIAGTPWHKSVPARLEPVS